MILTKKTAETEVTIANLETFTSYYIKVAAFTKEGDGVKSDKVICTTAQDGEFSLVYCRPKGSQIFFGDKQYKNT